MQILPAFDEFEETWERGENQLLRVESSADLDTPVSLMLKLAVDEPPCFLLESVTGGEVQARYSVLGLRPDLTWRCRGPVAEIQRGPNAEYEPEDLPPVDSLRRLLHACRIPLPANLPPMIAGLFGYLSYDMIRQVEHLPEPNPDPLELPDAMLIRPSVVAVIDNVKGQVTLAAAAWYSPDSSARAAYDQASELLQVTARQCERTEVGPRGEARPFELPELTCNTTVEEYRDMVERAKTYIRAGDIFQVVPSQRWSLPFPLPPFALYRGLRRTNPSPYMFYFDLVDFQIVGASPEILVRLRDGTVTIRPIAGTRPRGSTRDEDLRLEAELLADPKERAEHLMLLDLGRNDVGRVAEIGSVVPTEQFTIERYSHVMHIVSNVDGRLREDCDALDALLAGLPAGTVSGAPKIRAMEIIDELEVHKRGVYAGAVGYFSSNGEMDTCIALRTAVLKDGQMHIQAGGGVVYDSDPQAEYEETVAKSGALRRAAQEAADFVRPAAASPPK